MRLLCLLAVCIATAAVARPKPIATNQPPISATLSGVAWSPQQAVGTPNCPSAGDNELSWATMAANGGIEWIELEFASPVPVAKIIVHQNDNPGAIIRIEAHDTDTPTVLWSGESARGAAPLAEVFVAEAKATTQTIRVVLDTRIVPGWNEIDAVELIGRDGSRQWAASARASSAYGSGAVAGGIWQFAGKAVELSVGGSTMSGVAETIDGTWMAVRNGQQTTLVNISRIDWIRAAR